MTLPGIWVVVFAGILLAWSGLQDWKRERFNAVLPVVAVAALIFTGTGFPLGAGFFLTIVFAGVLIHGEYIRRGDGLPLSVYAVAYTSIQSFFTLLTVVGVYLYVRGEVEGREEWTAFVPAIAIAYTVQFAAVYLL